MMNTYPEIIIIIQMLVITLNVILCPQGESSGVMGPDAPTGAGQV